jgi:hypothetical protein
MESTQGQPETMTHRAAASTVLDYSFRDLTALSGLCKGQGAVREAVWQAGQGCPIAHTFARSLLCVHRHFLPLLWTHNIDVHDENPRVGVRKPMDKDAPPVSVCSRARTLALSHSLLLSHSSPRKKARC